jgi:hypothetical protein
VAQPSMMDVLQTFDRKRYPQLPSYFPDWFRKPIKELPPGEIRLAKIAVAAYAEGANKLVAAVRVSAANPRSSCPLFYVPEAYFGFDKLARSQPAPNKNKPRAAP